MEQILRWFVALVRKDMDYFKVDPAADEKIKKAVLNEEGKTKL